MKVFLFVLAYAIAVPMALARGPDWKVLYDTKKTVIRADASSAYLSQDADRPDYLALISSFTNKKTGHVTVAKMYLPVDGCDVQHGVLIFTDMSNKVIHRSDYAFGVPTPASIFAEQACKRLINDAALMEAIEKRSETIEE